MLAHLRRILRPAEVHARRHHVDDVARLVAELALRGDARRPVGDERRADAPFVTVVFVQPERRAAGVGPPAAVAVVGLRTPHRRESGTRVECVLRPATLVEPERVPLGARPVVAQEQDQRVVEFAVLLQVVHHAADVPVHARHHRRVHRHSPGEVRAPVGVERVPRRVRALSVDAGPRLVLARRRQRRPLGEQADLDLPGVPFRPQFVPPLRVRVCIRLDVVRLGVQGEVRGVERQVLQERLLRLAGLGEEVEAVVAEGVRAVEPVFRVFPLLPVGRQAGVERVFLEARVEPADHAVELVEPAVGGPRRLRPGAQVPLAHHAGVVAGGPKDLGNGDGVRLREPLVAAGVGLVVHQPDAGLMRVQAGQQTGTTGAAAGAVVELAEPQAVLREGVERRRGDLPAVAAEVGVPEVVGEDEQHVRFRGRFGHDHVRRREKPGKQY